ncbi:putative SNARE associated Golgi protein [Lyophyllum shimeji]|uniref:Golgi apparatus membrane protein TVP38 n=1 Tax=Lyophyllum shimeji TaxID=47721 RepID=A0A9P3PXC6_LYOSH|nr:putative SNARE associated Golgi protein [Lyophyllum shimeji]
MMMTSRTPSPTPSEERELKTGVFDWKTLGHWRFWIRREWLWYYVAVIVILVVTALVSIYHKQIVHWLTPVTRWLKDDLRFGWLVPIGVLFVISFPPLFGHEIVAILCGLVWGLWVGFGIVSAGTFLGEVGNFYAFKYCCRARGEKLERTKITYACLAKVVRDGGFKIALIARLSAIPGHFTTAVFSACGMGIIVFSLAAILSMPKQFITVYLGVILEQSSTGVKDRKSTIISDVVLAITFIITLVAMWYIYRQMNKVKPEVIYQRRKARQAKLARAGLSPYGNDFSSSSTVAFDPYASNVDSIPLKVQTPSVTQSWESHSSSSAESGPNAQFLYAPQPKKARLPPPEDVDVDVEAQGYGYGYGGYGHHHARAEASAEDVGWDMQMRPTQHARPEDMYGLGPFASTETVQQSSVNQHASQPYVAPPPGIALPSSLPQGAPPHPQMQDAQTPMQAHFATHAQPPPPLQSQQPPPAHSQTPGQTPTQAHFTTSTHAPPPAPAEPAHDLPGPLPLPNFDQPRSNSSSGSPAMYYGHAQEATDASYRTAREPSTDDDDDTQHYHPVRVASPPPPSYTTHER